MKKVLLIVCLTLSMFATSAFSQEVRGVETRRVTYEGPMYQHYDDWYNTYYGFEFHNLNSISVSVDIEIYLKSYETDNRGVPIPDKLIDTKTIVLKPNETYVYKRENSNSFRKSDREDGYSLETPAISEFYVKYKAYKVL